MISSHRDESEKMSSALDLNTTFKVTNNLQNELKMFKSNNLAGLELIKEEESNEKLIKIDNCDSFDSQNASSSSESLNFKSLKEVNSASKSGQLTDMSV